MNNDTSNVLTLEEYLVVAKNDFMEYCDSRDIEPMAINGAIASLSISINRFADGIRALGINSANANTWRVLFFQFIIREMEK